MGYFQHIVTRFDGLGSLVSGVSALALQDSGTGLRLISASGVQGGLIQRDMSPDLGVVAASVAYADLPAVRGRGGDGRSSVAGLANLVLNGQPVLVSYGATEGARGFGQNGANELAQCLDLGIGKATVIAIASCPLANGGDILFTSTLQGFGINTYLRTTTGTITALQQLVGAGGRTGYDVLAMATMQTATGTILLTVAAQSNSISAYQIDAKGQAMLCDNLGNADGLAISTPNLLQTLHFAGRDLVLLGAAGTGSITVLNLQSDKHLQVLDQVNDDLNTRFQGISVLKAVTIDGRAFVLAGGGDSGLTLMTLLPDGRLVPLETIADSLTTALDNVSALAVQGHSDVNGAALEVFTTGWTETSLSQFHIGLGTLAPIQTASDNGSVLQGDARADMLIGGAGADVIYGGSGADILVDGAGSDALYGGAGADIFVLSPDGVNDDIFDFNPAEDKLDLSALPMVYGYNSVEFNPMPGGIELSIRGETLRLFSGDGHSFTPEEFSDSNMVGLWHIVPVAMPDPGRFINGSWLADMLLGKAGNDTLQGAQGADTLQGGAGNDLLCGETLDTNFDRAAQQIYRVYRATLDRAPDQSGLFHWTGILQSGAKSLGQIIGNFVASPEFQARYGATTDGAFVTLLYNNVLHRAPDPGGYANWTAALASGQMSREAVVAGFSESREFRTTTEAAGLSFGRAGQQESWVDDVFRLYHATLDRNPDVNGLQSWTTSLANGTSFLQVVAGFVGSAEFQTRYGATTDSQFVTLLYNNVLGRAPDAGGLAGWTQALATGHLTRPAVVQGFSQSQEFIANSATSLVQFMKGLPTDDRLLGGEGDNLLVGGIGADTFVFAQSDSGTHRVADLERWDHIELQGFGYANAAEALQHFSQSGTNVVFDDQYTQVLFADRQLSDFAADMLIL